MSTVQLSNATVEIVDKITWGQKEQIKATMMASLRGAQGSKEKQAELSFSADAMLAAKYKAIEVCVVKITQEGEDIPFSHQWLDNLSIEDGDKLYDAVEAVTDPEKKS